MTIGKFFYGLLALSCPVFSLETMPWIGDQYEFDLETSFTYSRYCKVEGAEKQIKGPSNDYDLLIDVGYTATATSDYRIELELAKTPRQPFNWRSTAFQVRYQWWDDVTGDPVSVTTGLNIRGVPHHSLKDVSCPYASYANFELTVAVGKEWSQQEMWTMRTYGWASMGIANRGLPWSQQLAVYQINVDDVHEFSFFALGNFGFGGKQHVDVHHFNGWGEFQHQSIDLGAAYGYEFQIWGKLTATYAHRIFAHNFPQRVNFFTLTYILPFSLF